MALIQSILNLKPNLIQKITLKKIGLTEYSVQNRCCKYKRTCYSAHAHTEMIKIETYLCTNNL